MSHVVDQLRDIATVRTAESYPAEASSEERREERQRPATAAADERDGQRAAEQSSRQASQRSESPVQKDALEGRQDAPVGRKRTEKVPVCHRSEYKTGSLLGQGSFATVHKAIQLETGREVALKIVRPESELDFGRGPNGSTPAVSYKDVLKAMRQELVLMEALGYHPNIVEVLATTEDCRVFVLERATSDLYTIVKQAFQKRHQLQCNWFGIARLWAAQILTAVQYMHQMSLVHQDMKSSNILIFPDRTAKICDFGLARKGSQVMCVDRELVTLWYRAPELLMGDSVYSVKVDEWGAGCILLEMLIGTSPFRGKPETCCNCPQITHRNYNSDQLMKIFGLMGTPKDKTLLARSACTQHFSRWPVFPRKLESTLQKVFSTERCPPGVGTPQELSRLADHWGHLIGGLLDLDPNSRWTASYALRVPLMASSSSSLDDKACPTGPGSPFEGDGVRSHSERRASTGGNDQCREASTSARQTQRVSSAERDSSATGYRHRFSHEGGEREREEGKKKSIRERLGSAMGAMFRRAASSEGNSGKKESSSTPSQGQGPTLARTNEHARRPSSSDPRGDFRRAGSMEELNRRR